MCYIYVYLDSRKKAHTHMVNIILSMSLFMLEKELVIDIYHTLKLQMEVEKVRII